MTNDASQLAAFRAELDRCPVHSLAVSDLRHEIIRNVDVAQPAMLYALASVLGITIGDMK